MTDKKERKKIGLFDVFGIIILFAILVFPNLQHGAGATIGAAIAWLILVLFLFSSLRNIFEKRSD